MKKLTCSFPAKVAAIFFSVLLCYGLALSAFDLTMAYEYGILTESVSSYFETDDCIYRMQGDAHTLYYRLSKDPEPAPSVEPDVKYEYTDSAEEAFDSAAEAELVVLDGRQLVRVENPFLAAGGDGYYYLLDDWHADETNFRFAAYNPTNGAVYANDKALVLQLVEKLFQETNGYVLWENLVFLYEHLNTQNEEAPLAPDAVASSIRYITIDGYVFCVGVALPVSEEGGMPVRDGYARGYRAYRAVMSTYKWAAALIAVLLPAFFADIIFLCCAAGRRAGYQEPVLNYQDRIPLDLYLTVTLLGIAFCIGIVDSFWNSNLLISLAICLVLFTGAFLLALATLLTLCTRIKAGRWWRNTITFQFFRLCWRVCRGMFRWTWRAVHTLALTWRVALVCAALICFNLFFAGIGLQSGAAILLYGAVNGGAALVLCSSARQMHQLLQAGASLANGELGREVDTARLYGDLRLHGEHLNSLSQGMTIALEQKMRSERLKTELITNVSHDIKTPLTSIINYVDLLQKTGDEEQRQQYLSVLDRQAKRLKKLTEDLVEASKASTGNLPANLLPTNLQEIMDQAIGEYEDRLQAAQLEVVVTLPAEGLSAVADGRLLWRVLDNLLNNACKYAQPGTRVYLDAAARGNLAVISMKNISHQQLNLSPDELMERFVRGDSSRNTEGSGLGLNIAKSLVELQKGHFTLAIDGDLFKAVIALPLYRGSELLETETAVTLHE